MSNKYKFNKQIMRLCAFAMVENQGIQNDELIVLSDFVSMNIDKYDKIEDHAKDIDIVDDDGNKNIKFKYNIKGLENEEGTLCIKYDDKQLIDFLREFVKNDMLQKNNLEVFAKEISKLVKDDDKGQRLETCDVIYFITPYVDTDKLKDLIEREYKGYKKGDIIKVIDLYKRKIQDILKRKICSLCFIKECELSLKSNYDISKSIFMNIESLTEEEKIRELINMVIIAKADESLTDRERELFCIICKLYGIEDGNKLWKELTVESIETLRSSEYSSNIMDQYFKNNKKRLNANDFKNIEQSIKFYDINGPIIDGIYHLLERDRIAYKESILKQDKEINDKALCLFALSALLIFLGVLDIKNHSFLLGAIGEIIPRHKCDNGEYIITIIKVFLSLLSGILGAIAIYRCKNKKNDKSGKTKENWMRPAVWGIGILVLAFKSIALLIMMLSIEWLIFMKEQLEHNYSTMEENKDTNDRLEKKESSLLVVIVAAAIIADISLGLIEIYQVETKIVFEMFLVKMASAVFLGCICFFSGKFLENYRNDQIRNISTMNKVIAGIGRRMIREELDN